MIPVGAAKPGRRAWSRVVTISLTGSYRLVESADPLALTLEEFRMRRNVGLVLAGVFGFFLMVGLLAQFYAPGVLKKTPLNVDSVTNLVGTVVYLGEERAPAKVWQKTRSIGDASTDEVVVFENFTCIMKNPDGTAPDAPVCLDEGDDRLVNAGGSRFATDRETGEAVNDPELTGSQGQQEGLVNKFPFDVEQRAYPIWDSVLGRSVEAQFVGEEVIDGLTTYKFQITVDNEPAEVAAGTQGQYSDDKTMWIDPVTGAIMAQTERQVRMVDDYTALDLDMAFTDESIAANVEDAKANGSQLSLLGNLPWIAYLIALAAGIGALVVLRRDEMADDRDGGATYADEGDYGEPETGYAAERVEPYSQQADQTEQFFDEAQGDQRRTDRYDE